MCIWVGWPRSAQHSQQLRLNPTPPLRRQCGSDQNDQQRTKPKTQGNVARTHRVDLEWLFERVNLDHCILIKYVRTTDQLADILTGNVHHDAMASFVDFVANQTTLWTKWSPQLFSQTFLLLSFRKAPKRCLRRWHTPSWPDMESTRIKIIEIRLRTWLWSNWAIMIVIVHSLPARMPFAQKAEGNLLQVETSSLIPRNNWIERQLIPSTENCWRCTRQKFTSLQNPSYVWDKGAMNEPQVNSPTYGMIISSNTGNLKRFMSFNNSSAVDRVLCPFQAHGLSENSLCMCTQVWGCTGTENSVHALKTECIRGQVRAPLLRKRDSALPAHSARSSKSQLRSNSTRSAASGHQECLPCPDSWNSRDRYRLSRQAAP